jgi:hypothetical protein
VVVPTVCGSSVSKLLHVTHLAHRIFMWLLEFWIICIPLAIGQIICMYSILAVCASCSVGFYNGMSILRTYTHIYRGFCTVFVPDICVVMSMHTVCRCAVASCTGYSNVQMSIGNCLTMQALAWLLMVQFRAICFVEAILGEPSN